MEKTWFLLANWFAKNSKGNDNLLQQFPDKEHCQKLILLHYFHLKIFQERPAISKKHILIDILYCRVMNHGNYFQ